MRLRNSFFVLKQQISLRQMIFIGLAIAGLFVGSGIVQAADLTWLGACGDWSIASNWGGTVPTSSDNVYIRSDGLVILTKLDATCNTLYLGNAGESGTLMLVGGDLSSGDMVVGETGLGTCALIDGMHSIAGNLLLGSGTGSSGIYYLEGGMLEISGETIAQGSGSGNFHFGCGTLVAENDLTVAMPLTLTGGGSGEEKSIIDTNGHVVSITGGLDGVGGLYKTGNGTLTIPGDSIHYTGETAVAGGTLAISGGSATLGKIVSMTSPGAHAFGTCTMADGSQIFIRANHPGLEGNVSLVFVTTASKVYEVIEDIRELN